MKKILITGATGLIGEELTKQCLEVGIFVNYLTTSKEKLEHTSNYKGYYWNPQDGEIDETALEGVSTIVNLAGASISERWTDRYKKIIVDSRIKAIDLLYRTLQKIDHEVTHFISASGVNIYPSSHTKLYTEESTEVGDNFLSKVVVAWEQATARFKDLGMEVTKVRTGMVLARDEGALPKLVRPIKLGFGAPLGSGNQWQSWIHIEDIAGIYLFILKHQLEGIFNAVAPNPVQNKKMTKLIASHLGSPLWLPPIPGFILRAILGDMSILVLEGMLVSSKKIEELGYSFKFYNAETALQDLLQ